VKNMILYNANDIKIGSDQVVEVRAGSDLVWPVNQLWTFSTPSGGEQIRLTPTFSGTSTVSWGDGSSDSLTSTVPINHTYS